MMRELTVSVELTAQDINFLDLILRSVEDLNTEEEADTLVLLKARIARAQAELASARAMSLALGH